MILPPNSLHSFYNRTSEPCRVLGISTQLHQTFRSETLILIKKSTQHLIAEVSPFRQRQKQQRREGATDLDLPWTCP